MATRKITSDALRQAKKKPTTKKKTTATPRPDTSAALMADAITELGKQNLERDKAVIEAVNKIAQDRSGDVKVIGDQMTAAVGEMTDAIKNMPTPKEREPVAYRAEIERDGKGKMTAAVISPIT